MVQLLANLSSALIAFTYFNADCGLPDTRQHFFKGQWNSQQSFGAIQLIVSLRRRILRCPQRAMRMDFVVEAAQARKSKNDRVYLPLFGQFFQSCGNIAADRYHLQIWTLVQQLGASASAAGGDD